VPLLRQLAPNFIKTVLKRQLINGTEREAGEEPDTIVQRRVHSIEDPPLLFCLASKPAGASTPQWAVIGCPTYGSGRIATRRTAFALPFPLYPLSNP
jgi:hypothetical protein